MMCMIIGRPKPEIIYTDIAVDNTTTATHTYSGVSLGTASTNRAVLVGVASGASTTGVTVAGVSATQITSGAGARPMSIWIAAVPSGTTGTIVVTQSAADFGIFIGVAVAYNLRSATAIDTAYTSANSGAPSNVLTVSVDTEVNGVAFGMTILATVDPSPDATWSGLVEGGQLTPAANCASVATLNTTTAQTPRPITASWNQDAAYSKAAIAASFS